MTDHLQQQAQQTLDQIYLAARLGLLDTKAIPQRIMQMISDAPTGVRPLILDALKKSKRLEVQAVVTEWEWQEIHEATS